MEYKNNNFPINNNDCVTVYNDNNHHMVEERDNFIEHVLDSPRDSRDRSSNHTPDESNDMNPKVSPLESAISPMNYNLDDFSFDFNKQGEKLPIDDKIADLRFKHY
jgi:hypothetical protein